MLLHCRGNPPVCRAAATVLIGSLRGSPDQECQVTEAKEKPPAYDRVFCYALFFSICSSKPLNSPIKQCSAGLYMRERVEEVMVSKVGLCFSARPLIGVSHKRAPYLTLKPSQAVNTSMSYTLFSPSPDLTNHEQVHRTQASIREPPANQPVSELSLTIAHISDIVIF